MTNFGAYLGQVIAADFGDHRSAFAAACGLTPPAITNYLTKDDLPAFATLGRVANAIQDEFKRAELVRAYWEDIQDRAKIKGVAAAFTLSSGRERTGESAVDREVDAVLSRISKRMRSDAAYRRIVRDISEWPT